MPRVDHVTHSALLWILVGSAVLAMFLWLGILSSSEGRQRNDELDRLLSIGAAAAEVEDDTEARIRSVAGPAPEPDRFRLLGDPEYGLFLDESGAPAAPVSAA